MIAKKLLSLLLFTTAFAISGLAAAAPVGYVHQLKGTVTLRDAGKQPVEAKAGDTFEQGANFTTAAGAEATLKFEDGQVIVLAPNTQFIATTYVYDQKKVTTAPFTVDTPGGVVNVVIQPGGQQLTVDMGHVSFDSAKIPVTGPAREVINEKITILDQEFTYCAATIGNPHCVIPLPAVTPELAHKYGPPLEIHANFPRKTNVQFLQVLDRANIRIEIWERGAGYTPASGSSSAAAAACKRLGLVDDQVRVQMPGGTLDIEFAQEGHILMSGPVQAVFQGQLLAGWTPNLA